MPLDLTPENQKTLEQLPSFMGEMKDFVSGRKTADAETQKKIDDFIGKHEKLNDELVAKTAAANKTATELKEQIEALEARLATSGDGKKAASFDLATKDGRQAARHYLADDQEPNEYKSFWAFAAGGTDERRQKLWSEKSAEVMGKSGGLAFDTKTLRTDRGPDGGFLVPPVMDMELRKNITEISPTRQLARMRMAPGKSIEIVRRLTLPESFYEGEGEATEQSQSKYGTETLTLHRHTVQVPVTFDQLIMSPVDLETEIIGDVSESFARKEGQLTINGSGLGQPQGFLADTRVEAIETASSGQIDFQDLAEIIGRLKTGYNPYFGFNRRTFSHLLKIKDAENRPIWSPVAGQQPATIWGFPYSSGFIDMDNAQAGAGAKPIFFGDLMRGYEIFDLIGTRLIRDEITQAGKAIIILTLMRYNTAKVTLPEAIKYLKIKA